jgi:hypothetical protein
MPHDTGIQYYIMNSLCIRRVNSQCRRGKELIAEPLGLATQEKMDFGSFSATSTSNISSTTIGHRRKKKESKWGKTQISD